jgi:hypothetical protein
MDTILLGHFCERHGPSILFNSGWTNDIPGHVSLSIGDEGALRLSDGSSLPFAIQAATLSGLGEPSSVQGSGKSCKSCQSIGSKEGFVSSCGAAHVIR